MFLPPDPHIHYDICSFLYLLICQGGSLPPGLDPVKANNAWASGTEVTRPIPIRENYVCEVTNLGSSICYVPVLCMLSPCSKKHFSYLKAHVWWVRFKLAETWYKFHIQATRCSPYSVNVISGSQELQKQRNVDWIAWALFLDQQEILIEGLNINWEMEWCVLFLYFHPLGSRLNTFSIKVMVSSFVARYFQMKVVDKMKQITGELFGWCLTCLSISFLQWWYLTPNCWICWKRFSSRWRGNRQQRVF